MREIKFRAWNTRQQVMGIAVEFSVLLQYTADNPHRASELPFLKYMQYTGLKDKNGKEIYEGDIVKPDGRTQSYQVAYEAPSFIITRGIYRGDVLKSFCKYSEVIGNIYENPELLGGKDVRDKR